MASPSFLKRKEARPQARPATDPLAEEAGPVQQARAHARRRLIGAVVLLAIGVIVFPLLFETQPRPLPGAVPIEMPAREGPGARTAALPPEAPAMRVSPPVPEPPPAEPARPAPATPVPPPAATTDAGPEPTRTAKPVSSAGAEKAEKIEKAGNADKSAKTESADKSAGTGNADKSTVTGNADKSASGDAGEKPAPARKDDAQRARALLEGRPAPVAAPTPADAGPAPAPPRFVVQVGAYGDAATLRDVRSKVEKLGLKTYTQVVQTEGGPRTRVRVGPFASRQEAEKANDTLAAAGLRGNLLTL